MLEQIREIIKSFDSREGLKFKIVPITPGLSVPVVLVDVIDESGNVSKLNTGITIEYIVDNKKEKELQELINLGLIEV